MIDYNRPVTIFSAIHTSYLDGEAVLFDARRGLFFALDEPAGRIWSLLQQRYTIGQIIDQLLSTGEIVEVRRCIDLLHAWRSRGLIRLPIAQVVDAASSS
jgi:hypothetical protein